MSPSEFIYTVLLRPRPLRKLANAAIRAMLPETVSVHGAKIALKHKTSNLADVQVVVTSSAIAKTNVELQEAERRGIPIIARAELLAELMRVKYGVAVAGSHGKTTTTSLVAAVLTEGGLDPTAVIGGQVKNLRSNAKLGKGEFLVAEADESDGSFLHLSPIVAVITNIDKEHLDHYRDFETLQRTFVDFAAKVPFYGVVIICHDDPWAARIKRQVAKRVVTYGLEAGADLTAHRIRSLGLASEFQVKFRGQNLGEIHLNLPGRHNILNSLAAIAVGLELGIKFAAIRKALARFLGVGRRLERIYENRVTIVDDYGHHPSEILATLAAVRGIWKKERLWVLFQPHRYSRTKSLFEEFVNAFGGVDRLLMVPIYPAGEEPIQGVSSEVLVASIQKKSPATEFVANLWDLPELVLSQLQPGDVILTLGAGDIWKVGKEIAKRLEKNGS